MYFGISMGLSSSTVAITVDTPTLSSAGTVIEEEDIVITIDNYDSDEEYFPSATAGSFSRTGDAITWTSPTVSEDTDYNISVYATKGGVESDTAIETITTTNVVPPVVDQTILFENATMSATEFPTTTNIDISGNTLLAEADTVSTESAKVEQDIGDTDFINATPTSDNTAINYTISAGATTTSVTITAATTFVTGDTLLMNKVGTTALSEIDTTSITTDNTGDSYTFDITGLSFTSAPTIATKDTASISISLVDTGDADSFVERTAQSHTADNVGGTVINNEFEIALWTGDTTSKTKSLSNITGDVDFIWSKTRTNTAHHSLEDSIRGASNRLITNLTNAEDAQGNMVSFGTGEFTYNSTDGSLNGITYVAWCSTLPTDTDFNTDGSITSVTKNNSFMSAVSFTGTGANATVGHSLEKVPELVIVKNVAASVSWGVYHSALANTEYLFLNANNVKDTGATYWNSTTPTTSVFSVGSISNTNGSSNEMIAYCFSSVTGKCKVGSFSDSATITGVGFESCWIMAKRIDSVGSWIIVDNERSNYLVADTTNPESTNGANPITITSDGFTTSLSTGDYIYIAIAKEADNSATLITDVFDTDSREGRDFKVKPELADSGDEVTRISIPIQKLG